MISSFRFRSWWPRRMPRVACFFFVFWLLGFGDISWEQCWMYYGLTHNSTYLDMGFETWNWNLANWNHENWPYSCRYSCCFVGLGGVFFGPDGIALRGALEAGGPWLQGAYPCIPSYSWAPVKPPRGQTLRSPQPKVTSVLTRSRTEQSSM